MSIRAMHADDLRDLRESIADESAESIGYHAALRGVAIEQALEEAREEIGALTRYQRIVLRGAYAQAKESCR